jgi:hypothetical protein
MEVRIFGWRAGLSALVAVLAGLALALAGAAPARTTTRARTRHPVQSRVHYYLALGDSLSQGVQPTSAGQPKSTNFNPRTIVR